MPPVASKRIFRITPPSRAGSGRHPMMSMEKSNGPLETGGGSVMVGVRVAVAVGVGLGVRVIAAAGVGGTRVGSRVPGASGGSVACVEVPDGVGAKSSGAGVAELAKLQASKVNDNATK